MVEIMRLLGAPKPRLLNPNPDKLCRGFFKGSEESASRFPLLLLATKNSSSFVVLV